MGRRAKRNELLTPISIGRDDVIQAIRDVSGASKNTATAIETAFRSGRGLANASARQLEHLGATPGQAKKIIGAFALTDLCDRACQERASEAPLKSPNDVAAFVRSAIGRKPQEYFIALLLDARQNVIDARGVSVGSLAEVSVHPRELFRDAVRIGAHSVIIAHNHPSGDAEPSEADVDLTHRMAEVGRLVGIPVLDHLVVTPDDFSSLAQLGLLPGH